MSEQNCSEGDRLYIKVPHSFAESDAVIVPDCIQRARKIGAASVMIEQSLGAELWAKRAHDRGELSPELRKMFYEYLAWGKSRSNEHGFT